MMNDQPEYYIQLKSLLSWWKGRREISNGTNIQFFDIQYGIPLLEGRIARTMKSTFPLKEGGEKERKKR